ncbi:MULTISPECIES: hypothetical protein [Hyphomonas]|jgi:hypothetical protein|uniref:Alginate export domain-containing protein n=1 Tax=Hyphomonas chukchiensis TaxID=1280947 RepID=A0A062UCE1_9PROT|nr:MULTISPECIES: hypothetical protein [Hyphomonas]KCZ55987.1 hypothetical protein HY30_06945 [Hyphomonas chukchiensis]MAN89333.1 hypothetical protein [Hyphomonadaceae bacterium]MBG53880.1 hypothetical protein [Rhodobiaceae bacterium]HAQ76238.1 hypothetical protein [Hyphomonas sp.]|tara:strand:+ start:4745 stop:5965 length:1221 start_codon:yes stop_codon:yes gene_type:complete
MARFILTLSLLSAVSMPAFAEPDLGAEIKLQQQVLITRNGDQLEHIADDTLGISGANVRLKASDVSGPWSYDVNYLMEAAYSSRFEELNSLTPPQRAESPIDLEDSFVEGPDGLVAHRLDRFWIAHSTPKTVVRIGRQALSWGHGQVFQPLDLFNPFAPDAQDTSYKPGADMVYGQYLFDTGADIQAIIVPRKRSGGGLSSEESSFAVKGFWMTGSVELEVVAASDYGDGILAIGGASPLGDAVWKFDVVSTFKDGSDASVSAVTSLQNSWDWGGRPVTGFVEYYRNGFGVADRRASTELPEDLTNRVARGQLFNTGRDYLAVGASIDWTPLLTLTPTMIVNLNDASTLAIIDASYNLSDNVSLIAGAQLPLGHRRTEFGGRAVSPSSSTYDKRPHTLFFRIERYF